MASGGGILGNDEILDINWPEDLGLYSPTTFNVRIMGTRQSSSFKLYINGILIDETEAKGQSSFGFDYENIDLLSVGKDITVEIQGFDNNGVAIEGSRLTMTYFISTPTLAESVYCIFRALQNILKNGGYDTSKADGLSSLINILEEI